MSPLFNVPLVRSMATDPSVSIVLRPVDTGWLEAEYIPFDAAGFEPLGDAIYAARRSRLAKWLRSPGTPLRTLNERDLLVREVLRAAHDYLHVWTTRLIRQCVTTHVRDVHRQTHDGVELATFLHLLTEAAATVGLDYWYLCTIDLDDILRIGSTQGAGWSTAYHQRHIKEYRRSIPDLDVQSPSFFVRWSEFYFSGRLHGVRKNALSESPRFLRWADHELRYGALQRRYARLWFRYLATGKIRPRSTDAGPVDFEVPWRRDLVSTVGRELWRATRAGRFRCASPAAPTAAGGRAREVDFRFTAWSSLSEAERGRAVRSTISRSHRKHWLAQSLSEIHYEKIESDKRCTIRRELARANPVRLYSLLRDLPRVDASPNQPRHLLFLG